MVDNEDPLRLGRVKCLIDGLFPDQENLPVGTDAVDPDDPQIPADTWQALPWISQWTPPSMGGATNSGSFQVPEVGNELTVEFPYGDIYFGFYTGYWQSATTHPGMHNEDYPEAYGFEDSTGFRWRINKLRRTIEVTHPSGFAFRVDEDGNVDIQSRGKITMRDTQGSTGVEVDPETGQITQKSPTGQKITADLVIDNKSVVVDTGSWDESVTGSKEELIGAGHKISVGGSEGIVVAADRNIAAGGNESKLVGGSGSYVYGTGKEIIITLGDYTVETKLGSLELKNNLANLLIPISGIAELNGIMVKLQGGSQQMLLGQDFIQHYMAHIHPTGVGPSGPMTTAPQALQLLSPKSWLS